MKNFDKYRLELEKQANNSVNKRQDMKHRIKKEVTSSFKDYDHTLLMENDIFDAMGDIDLLYYEKWLRNGRF